ncbi:MAG: hypothetical protein ABW003_28165 [Microvirga sp.]
MVAGVGKNWLSGPPTVIESSLGFAGGHNMTRAAEEIDARADRERADEYRSYIEGIQLGNEAVLKALLSTVIAIYEPETADEKAKLIAQIRSLAMRSVTRNKSGVFSDEILESSVAKSVIRTVFTY